MNRDKSPRKGQWKWPLRGAWRDCPRRRVHVTVESWRGLSVGARHWYATIGEENNAVWDPRKRLEAYPQLYESVKERFDGTLKPEGEQYWNEIVGWSFPDDKVGKGRKFEHRTALTEWQAWDYVRKILARHFWRLDRYVFCVGDEKDETILCVIIEKIAEERALQGKPMDLSKLKISRSTTSLHPERLAPILHELKAALRAEW